VGVDIATPKVPGTLHDPGEEPMRRQFIGAVLVAALAGACGSTAGPDPTGEATGRAPVTETESRTVHQAAAPVVVTIPPATTTTVPAGTAPAGRIEPRAATTEPARALVVSDAGNSILFDAEPALAASLAPSAFRPHTIGGFGLSVFPEVWHGVFGTDVPADDPDVVVVMMGNKDFTAAVTDPVTYRAQLDEAVRLMTVKGARILWLGLPPHADLLEEQGRRAVNALFAELPIRFPGVVRYVPTDGVLGGPGGTYVRSMADGPVRKLQPDGSFDEHLCPAGAVRLAQLVRDELAAFVAVPPAPGGWQDQPWRGERRFDDPPGACRP
jgi:hypothetical protein